MVNTLVWTLNIYEFNANQREESIVVSDVGRRPKYCTHHTHTHIIASVAREMERKANACTELALEMFSLSVARSVSPFTSLFNASFSRSFLFSFAAITDNATHLNGQQQTRLSPRVFAFNQGLQFNQIKYQIPK